LCITAKGAIIFVGGDGSKMKPDVKAALVTRSRRGSLARLAVLLAAHRLRL
jgi:sulfite reductase alpha subunit-like flavoprotein